MKRIIIEVSSSGVLPYKAWIQDYTVGPLKSAMNATRCYSKEEVKKTVDKFLDFWPEIYHPKEMEEKIEEKQA